MSKLDFMNNLGLGELNSGVSSGNEWLKATGTLTESKTPVDDTVIAQIQNASLEDYEKVITRAQHALRKWRSVPAPGPGRWVPGSGPRVAWPAFSTQCPRTCRRSTVGSPWAVEVPRRGSS